MEHSKWDPIYACTPRCWHVLDGAAKSLRCTQFFAGCAHLPGALHLQGAQRPGGGHTTRVQLKLPDLATALKECGSECLPGYYSEIFGNLWLLNFF